MGTTKRDPLDRFVEQRTVLLSSFKRDGTAAGTPVNIAVGDDHAYHAARLIEEKHPVLQGILVPVGHRLKRVRTLHFELTPIGA